MSFDSLGLAPALLSSIERTGFTTPTPVQMAAIPPAMAGSDLMVSSQTGSGKTAAFMLPALHRIAQKSANKGRGVQVLVLTPTRELALQVSEATAAYGSNLDDLRIATVVGGMPYGAQLKALSRRVDVLVATPGRLLDHLQARRVDLSTVHTLVLDEADRMLDMGFIDDINTIVDRTPQDRQTLLFSATLDGTVAKLAARMMRDPQRIELASQSDRHANITQTLLYADDAGHKLRLLDHILRDAAMDQAIVFTATKRGADDLAEHLADTGFSVMALHGDMNQRQRSRTLTEVQDGRVRVLVATDVAARGIDVQAISHAINYDLPMQPEDYVHRIGRTGRAGRDGLAYTLAVHGERHKVRRIEHFIGHQIPSEVIAGLEPQRTPSARPEGAGRGAGGKKGGRFSNDRSSAPSGGGYAGRESRPYAPRADKPFADRGERSFAPRGDKPFAPRGDKPFAPRGDKPFAPRGDKPFAPRGDKPFADRGEKSFAPRGDKPFAPRGEKSYAPRGEKSYGDRSYAPRGDQPHAARSDNPYANARTEPRSFEPRTDRGASDRPAYAGKPARPARDFAPRAAAPSGKTFAPRGDAPARSGAPRPGAPRAATGARRGFTFDGGRR
ncbi:MAG: DEAD/DEAH box helicase [Candidatus Methylopumilus sp.]|nr:DEAD/DEAH box helicase [Candidatus Methylopumilus sp.]